MEDVTGKTPHMDWLNILRYHREVIEKGSDDFFSILAEGIERYTRLLHFYPETFEGPWSITADEMIMAFLEEQFSNGENPQLILGCLYWESSKKGKRYLNPLLYMDVSIEQGIEDSIILKPESLHWNFSPSLESAIRNKQIKLQENLHEKLPELLKKAAEGYNPATKDLAAVFKNALLNELPIFKEILAKDLLGWILFTPPKSYVFTRHILNDYKEIERQIKDKPEEIGGLRLLELLQSSNNHDSVDILPVVPLNPEQKHAVANILSDNPITVVSGPPGCGKSQVVVSLLINCWAEGKTALFASYVNNAVSVIHDRITAIEEEAKRSILPVTIKAGKENNICPGIRKVKDSIIQYRPIKPEAFQNLQIRKRELETKKEEFQKCINTGVPQQIDESLHSAFDAYAIAMEHNEMLNEQYREYTAILEQFGYPIKPEEFGDRILSIEAWLQKRFRYATEIKENIKIINEYQEKADIIAEDIDNILESFNLKYNSRQWHLLLQDTGSLDKLIDWYEEYKSTILQEDLQKAVRSNGVKNDHRVWSGTQDVEEWLGNAQILIDKIVSMLHREKETIEKIKLIQHEYDHWTNIVTQTGFSKDFEFDSTILISWKTLYKEYVTIPRGMLPNPFTRRANIERNLRDLEKTIIPILPQLLKQAIGIVNVESEKKISDLSRSALSPHLDELLSWFEAKDRRRMNAQEDARVRSAFEDLMQDFDSLKLFYPPVSMLDIDGWQNTVNQLSDKIRIAGDAREAFIANESIQNLKKILIKFGAIAANSPVKSAWSSNAGKKFSDSIKRLMAHPDPDSLEGASDIVMANDFDLFVFEWKQLIGHIQQYIDTLNVKKEIPSEEEISHRWWAEDPTSGINYPDKRTIPTDVGDYEKHLEKCRDIQHSWNKHTQKSIPEKERIIQENLLWARTEIENACRKIPDETARLEIEEDILPFIQQHDEQWPLQQIRSEFEQFRSSELNMQIARMDQKLQILSFEIASNQRVERLRTMNMSEGDTVCDSQNNCKEPNKGSSKTSYPLGTRLTDLLDFYEKAQRNSYTLPQENTDLFSGCLAAIPIWVTTSLSTQSIPRKAEIFDLVVIDEACQCDVSSVLPMIYRARSLAVIGDPHQLDAINMISSPELDRKIAKDHGIEGVPDSFRHINNNLYKLAERSLPHNSQVIDLLEHYRSHPQIVGFINMHVYNKKLIIKKEIDCTEQDLAEEGIFGVDVKGACERISNSWRNAREADEVVRVARELIQDKGYNGSQIGVVTPFSPQKTLIERKINSELNNLGITVGTANTFQGNERDIMIFSPVLSQGIWDVSINFVQNPVNRINVALSRAKNALYVVADFDFCKNTSGILSELIHYIETIKALRVTAKEQGYEQLYLYTLMLIEGWKPAVDIKIGGITVDLALQESGAKIAIFITTRTISESEKARRIEAVKSKGFELMDIPARKISETPKEVIVTIQDRIEQV